MVAPNGKVRQYEVRMVNTGATDNDGGPIFEEVQTRVADAEPEDDPCGCF